MKRLYRISIIAFSFTLILLIGIRNYRTQKANVIAETFETLTETETQIETETETTTESTTSGKIYVTLTATAYCSCEKCCGKYADGKTACGATPKSKHTIAVDPKAFPFGTKFLINGIEYVAEDRGGALKGNRIDIYFDTHAEAEAFGKQTIEAEIVPN